MNRYYYDFHIHSCLSPCGDTDMTPNNIVNMAKLKGLDAIALTDHNTCGNCKSVVEAGMRAGLTVLPGMELCTSEDIHCVCLFSSLDGALEFSGLVRSRMPTVMNKPDIFGEQLLMDENDNITGTEEILLINAANIDIDSVRGIVAKYGGTAFPAHVDKASNSIMATLGGIPPEADFRSIELSSGCSKSEFLSEAGLEAMNILVNSDAHYLWQISERENCMEMECLDAKQIILSI